MLTSARYIFSLVLFLVLSVTVVQAQVINTVAGNGIRGYSGDGGSATSASLNRPFASAMDANGNLYIGDSENRAIRKVTPNGIGVITTILGTGQYGFINTPTQDIGDFNYGFTILPVPARGQGIGRTYGVATDSLPIVTGNVFVTDRENGSLYKIDGDGNVHALFNVLRYLKPSPSRVARPMGIAVRPDGTIFVADPFNGVLLKVVGNQVSIIAGAVGSLSSAGDGGPATAARLGAPIAVALDSKQNIYIAEYFGNKIRRIDAVTGIITTFAGTGVDGFSGDGGPARNAQFSGPSGVAFDLSGNLYIADSFNVRIRKVNTDGIITTIAGNGTAGFAGDGGNPLDAQFNPFEAFGLGLSGDGSLFVADEGNHRIRKIEFVCPVATISPLVQQEPPKIRFVIIEAPKGPLDGPIDNNPKGIDFGKGPDNSGGKRIFPDADKPGETPKREVRITIQATKQTDVFVKSFDVHDAGGLFTQKPDNQGPKVRPDGIPSEGAFRKKENDPIVQGVLKVPTDECGKVEIKFIVTMQPGDNFRVVASTDIRVINRLSVDGQQVVDPLLARAPVDEEKAKSPSGADAVMSQLLTAWRKMHIEVDDMGIVAGNDEGGTLILKKGGDKLTLNKTLPDQEDRFENGRMKVSATTAEFELRGEAQGGGSVTLTVNDTTITINTKAKQKDKDIIKDLSREAEKQGIRLSDKDKGHIVVASVKGQIPRTGTLVTSDAGLQVTRSAVFNRPDDAFDVEGNNVKPQSEVELKSDKGRQKDSFGDTLEFEGFICTSLVDDDDFNDNDAGQLRGDIGEDVTGLDLSLMENSDVPSRNVYASAFVVPTYDVGDNNKAVRFFLNTPGSFPRPTNDEVLRSIYDFDAKASQDDPNYWTVYLLGGYQDSSENDADPIDKKIEPRAESGRADNFFGEGGVVFLEVSPDESIRAIAEFVQDADVNLAKQVVTRAATAAHEIGHLFNAKHEDGGGDDLMGIPQKRKKTIFAAGSLVKIRTARNP